jgi:hypothetical protein
MKNIFGQKRHTIPLDSPGMPSGIFTETGGPHFDAGEVVQHFINCLRD